MNLLASLVCALALVFAVSAPAYAAGERASLPPEIRAALSGTVTVGDYSYSFGPDDLDTVGVYWNSLGTVASGDVSIIADRIKDIKQDIRQNPSAYSSNLWLAVSTNYNFTQIRQILGDPSFTIPSYSSSQATLTLTSGSADYPITVTRRYNTPSSDDDSSDNSGSTPSTSTTTPSSSTSTTATGANGGTAVSISTVPDAAPVVSGGTSSFGVTIPSTLVSSGISSATAEKPAQVNITAPTDTLVGQLNDSTVQAVAMNLTVPSEIAYGTAANVSVSMNVDSAVLSAAKQTGKDVSISVTDSLSGKVAYSWTFKGSDLAASGSELKNVNLSMNVKSTVLDSALSSAVPSDKKGVVLTFADNGTLPAPATVSVYVGDQGFAAGQTVYLYYYNQATGKIESVEYPSATVDSNGYASFVITHCSQYVAVPQQIAGAVAPVKIDTGSRLTVKAGKTYQFKITASSKPTFASGNGSVFQVTDNGSKGNDYFFKVTAVGKVGQSTGFYVNGAKAPATVGTIA